MRSKVFSLLLLSLKHVQNKSYLNTWILLVVSFMYQAAVHTVKCIKVCVGSVEAMPKKWVFCDEVESNPTLSPLYLKI